MKDKQLEQGFDLTAHQATARMVAALRKAHAMPPKEQKDMRRRPRSQSKITADEQTDQRCNKLGS